MQIQSLYTANI